MSVEFLYQVGLVFFILYGLGILFVFWTDRRGAPWVPMSYKKVRRMLKISDLQPGEKVYDLGSGDGRVLLVAAREFHAQAVGVEIDPLRVLWTRLMIALFGLHQQVRVEWGDLFTAQISDADVVTLFLRQRTNELLMVKLLLELRPGTRVVSHTFKFPGWEIIDQDRENHLFLYHVGILGLEDNTGTDHPTKAGV